MPRKTVCDPDAPFQGIAATSRLTGLSQYYIRSRCRKGDIPMLRVGAAEYKINVPLFLRQLEDEAKEGVTA